MSEAREAVRSELPPGRFKTFEQLQEIIFEFEKILGSIGIDITSGSRLEDACLSGLCLLMAHNQSIALGKRYDIRPDVVDACALWQFAERVNRLRGQPLLQQLKPHLQLLVAGDFAQNRKSLDNGRASDKLFELLIGLAAGDLGTDTELDDPTGLSGNNPDVLTTVLNKRWGFACKTMHSESAKTIYDRIEEAVDQIEKSPASIGIATLNLKNIIDHNSFFPIRNHEEFINGEEPVFGVFKEVSTVRKILTGKIDAIRVALINEIGEIEFAKTFLGKKALSGVLFVSQTALGIASTIGPIPSLITVLSFMPTRSLTSDGVLVFNAINLSMHDRLLVR